MDTKAAKTVEYLKGKRKVLFLTTSNRWAGHKELPKSTASARVMADEAGNASIIDVATLKINPCEGYISARMGNKCGVKEVKLRDDSKNPSGQHRCWVSYKNPEDELWKVSKAIFECDCVVFFASVRWGQTNSIHQKLMERLSWLETRHTTLGEDNILEGKDAGIILIGHNWRGAEVLDAQMKVLEYFGFNVVSDLCWSWEYTTPHDESPESYLGAIKKFDKDFLAP